MKKGIITVGFALFIAFVLSPEPLDAQWIRDGNALCQSAGDQWYGYITSDGSGGAIIAWYEFRASTQTLDVFAQRIDRNGNIKWRPEGVPICLAPGSQGDPQLISDGVGGALISWRDERSGNFDIYAQRVDSSGNMLWTTDGVAVCVAPSGQYMPCMISDDLGDFIIAWRDDRSGYGQIYCQKLDGNGNLLWLPTGIRICPTAGWQDWPEIISDAMNGAIVVWVDERSGPTTDYIYGQRLDGNGNLLWSTTGAPLCLFGYWKWSLDCIADGQGGGIAVWQGGATGTFDVRAQKFDSSGAILWNSQGLPICVATGDQIEPRLASDDTGGVIISWFDSRDGRDDIYAQRGLFDGNVKWQANGLMIHEGPPSSGFRYSVPDIVGDGNGGAVLSWQEGPGSPDLWDILAQRVDGDGNILWPDSAVSVCSAPGGQYFPKMAKNGDGGAIITWRDMRNGSKGAVYAMRVTDKGETVATLLQNYSAHIGNSSCITVEWTLSEVDSDAQFAVLRCEADKGNYQELNGAEIERNGLSFTYVDKACEPGMSYRYRVDVSDGRGRGVLFETEEISLPPLPLALFQNYPNPFNPSTTISYYLPSEGQVTLDIYDSSGKLISRLLDRENKPAGKHISEWRGVDDQGRPVSSGVYFFRLRTGKETISKKMVLLK